jgi:hypothetical protein
MDGTHCETDISVVAYVNCETDISVVAYVALNMMG